MNNKIVFVLLSILTILQAQVYDNCYLDTANGRVDLRKMYKENSEWTFQNQDESLKINICGPISKKCQSESHPAVSEVNNECFAFGKKDIQVKLKDPSNPNSNVQLIYQGGYVIFWPTRAVIEFTCDQNSDTQVKFIKADWNNNVMDYLFEAKSRDACPGGSSRGGLYPVGVGGILLIIGTFLLIVYFIVGILVNRFKFEKQGLEMVPQWYFWKELPFLFKDGIVWTFEGMKMGALWIKGKVSGNGYQEV